MKGKLTTEEREAKNLEELSNGPLSMSKMELQQHLRAEQNLTLNKAVTQAVARETAKRSQGILDTSQQVVTGIATYNKGPNKVVVPTDCCANYGNKRHTRFLCSNDLGF
jgi:preprotein translocase subunit SecA